MAHCDGGVPKETTQVGTDNSAWGWQGLWETAFQKERAEGANTRVQRAVLADRNSQGHRLPVGHLGKNGHLL